MGKIKDFLAKWQTIERPDWNREKSENKNVLRYKKEVTESERASIVEAEKVDEEDSGLELSVEYKEEEGGKFAVYAVFEDSETQDRIHLERFEHRKKAKDRLEELLDEYTEINVEH
jgi:hypothetical protein